jgi:hypothetical protein
VKIPGGLPRGEFKNDLDVPPQIPPNVVILGVTIHPVDLELPGRRSLDHGDQACQR